MLSIAVSFPSPRCFSLTFWVAVTFLLPFPLPPFYLSIFQKENGQFCHNLFWWRGKLPNYLLNHFESFWRCCWFPSVIEYWLASNFTAIFSWIFSLTKHAGHILILHLDLNSGFVFCILYEYWSKGLFWANATFKIVISLAILIITGSLMILVGQKKNLNKKNLKCHSRNYPFQINK